MSVTATFNSFPISLLFYYMRLGCDIIHVDRLKNITLGFRVTLF